MHYTSEIYYEDISGFKNYQIASDGRVINIKSGRNMALTPTEHGDLTVGLMCDRKQYRRSVKVLVAEAFVEGKSDLFDTPIQLDGNPQNLRADNILWRPRWFAWRFVRQFAEPIPSWHYIGPILEVDSGMQYRSIIESSITNGTLCDEIHNSILYGSAVFPTGEYYTCI